MTDKNQPFKTISLVWWVLSFSTKAAIPLPHWHYRALICTVNFSALANQYHSTAQNLIHQGFHIQDWNSSHSRTYIGFQSGAAKDSTLLGYDTWTASYPKQETQAAVVNMLGPEVALSLQNLLTHLLTYISLGHALEPNFGDRIQVTTIIGEDTKTKCDSPRLGFQFTY
jgi:hypothetical protein